MTPDPLLFSILVALAFQRCVELWLSRRNERRLAARGARAVPRDGLYAIAAAQAAVFVGALAESAWAPWAGRGPWTWPLLAITLGALALRYWAAFSLGDRYTVRVWAIDEPLVVRGPYRWMRHPIYRAVAIEVSGLAFAFGAWLAGAAGGLLHLAALLHRIRREEPALPPQRR